LRFQGRYFIACPEIVVDGQDLDVLVEFLRRRLWSLARWRRFVRRRDKAWRSVLIELPLAAGVFSGLLHAKIV
jgi:hypothetical protein